MRLMSCVRVRDKITVCDRGLTLRKTCLHMGEQKHTGVDMLCCRGIRSLIGVGVLCLKPVPTPASLDPPTVVNGEEEKGPLR